MFTEDLKLSFQAPAIENMSNRVNGNFDPKNGG